MNRKHSKEEFLQTIDLIRSYFPNAGITTDVIVGFPGETDEEAKETIETAKQANFFEMHIFPFSPREGTVASKMKPVSDSVKKQREHELQKLAKEMKQNFLNAQIGEKAEVLVETVGENGTAEGYAKNYVRVIVEGAKNTKEGDILYCTINRVDSDFAYAKL